MSLSVEELDATVRSFYEGRGDVVSKSLLSACIQADHHIAKASPADSQPSNYIQPDQSLQHNHRLMRD